MICVLCNKIIKDKVNKVGVYYMCTPCYEEAHDPREEARKEMGGTKAGKADREHREQLSLKSKLAERVTVRLTGREKRILERIAEEKSKKYNKSVTVSDVIRFAFQEYYREGSPYVSTKILKIKE